MKETLASLQARGDLYTRQLVNERQRITQFQSKLAEVNQNIVSTRESNKSKAIQLLNLNKHVTKSSTTTATTANTKSNNRDVYTRADGLNPTKTAIENQRKTIKSLEGRLNLALTRRNSIQTENNVIKEKINMLRRKICNDNTNRDCIEKELRAIQERMGEIMSRAAVASEQTDKVEEQRNQMFKEHMEGEEAFRQEYERLNAYVVEQARLLGESIATVANDVVAASGSGGGGTNSSGGKEARRGSVAVSAGAAAETDGDTQNGVAYLYEIRLLEDKVRQLDADNDATRQHLAITDESIRTNEEHLRRLREISGLESIDDIIGAFVKHEDEAFSLFCYIQALNQEIDETMEENSRIEHELESCTRHQMRQEHQRAAVVSKYRDALKEAEEERRQMNAIAREGRQTVQKIAANVQGLYFKLRCRQLEAAIDGRETSGSSDKDNGSSCCTKSTASHNIQRRPQLPVADRKLTIATGKEISERNILHHMELIEKRTCEIIASYAKRLASSKVKAQRRPSVIMVSMHDECSGRQVYLL
mmetsp:Transcript_21950/g.62949  ORF Transcript_21950/g.62949 Transcript_21950/m.62949 type:complete len:534 (+) Transcript_21950:141-1742(+)